MKRHEATGLPVVGDWALLPAGKITGARHSWFPLRAAANEEAQVVQETIIHLARGEYFASRIAEVHPAQPTLRTVLSVALDEAQRCGDEPTAAILRRLLGDEP